MSLKSHLSEGGEWLNLTCPRAAPRTPLAWGLRGHRGRFFNRLLCAFSSRRAPGPALPAQEKPLARGARPRWVMGNHGGRNQGERPPCVQEGSGRALLLKEVGGCNLERGASEGIPGCLQWVLQPLSLPVSTHRVFPNSAVFSPPKSGSGRRERGNTASPKRFCAGGTQGEPGRRPQGRAGGRTILGSRTPALQTEPRIFWGCFHIPHPSFPILR